jgi:Dyp-type peroxidase family
MARAAVATQAVNLRAAPSGTGADQIQTLIFSGFGHLGLGRVDLLSVTDPAACRVWLGRLAPAVTTADVHSHDAERALFVAFTAAGFRALGLDDDVLATFSTPFREGMVTPHRSRVLGDVDANDPTRWRWGAARDEQLPVHVLVISYWGSDAAGAEVAALLPVGTAETGTAVVYQHLTARLDGDKEHFGFVDGISQPRLVGGSHQPELPMPAPGGTAGDATWADVAAGEVLLGWRDESSHLARSPLVPAHLDPTGVLVHRDGSDRDDDRDLGRGGTYLVARQLVQDVAGFRAYLAEQTDDADAARLLGAKVIGRNQDGSPLGPTRQPADRNNFGFFDDDPTGIHCPIGSHIRRANPRDGRRAPDGSVTEGAAGTLANTKRHRILRRGRAYGAPLVEGAPDDGAERGLFFVCLNADLERQFEFVQHHWLNSATFARPGETDPLSSVGEGGCYSVPGGPGEVRRRYGDLPQFVTVVGGAYFFLPRVAVLRYLASLD